MSYLERVEHAINELENLDYTIDNIYQRVIEIIRSIGQFPTINYGIQTNDVFFRSRPNFDVSYFNLITEISYLPNNAVIEYKRSNIPGQSVFYCSDRRPTSYLELIEYMSEESQIGDNISVTISLWQAAIDFNVVLMINPNGRQEAEYNQRHRGGYEGLINSIGNDFKAGTVRLYEYFGEKFSCYANNRKDIYIITSALSNILISDSYSNGIMYPSVAFEEKGFNHALKRQVIDDVKLRLLGVSKDNFHIEATDEGNHNFIQATETENAIVNYSSGTLSWRELLE